MNVTRILMAGMLLAGLAVGLFLGLWLLLGALNVGDAPRLFASLCLPPAVVGALLIAVLLIRRAHGPDAK